MARPWCNTAQKPSFPTKLDCDLAITSIQSKNRRHRKQMFREEPSRSYPCDACGGYHMTSMSRNESRWTVSN